MIFPSFLISEVFSRSSTRDATCLVLLEIKSPINSGESKRCKSVASFHYNISAIAPFVLSGIHSMTNLTFFNLSGFLSGTFTTGSSARDGEGHFLTPLYHFHSLHEHLGISRASTAEGSNLDKANSLTRARYPCK